MTEAFTINPAAMDKADWAAVKDYLAAAAAAGEVVSLTSRLETLTPAQAAARLGMSRSTVSRKIAAGELHAIKVGAHHRITAAECDRYHDHLVGQMIAATSGDIEADLYAR